MSRSLLFFSCLVLLVSGCDRYKMPEGDFPKRFQDKWSPAGYRCLHPDEMQISREKIIVLASGNTELGQPPKAMGFTVKSFHGNEYFGTFETTSDLGFNDGFYTYFPTARNAKDVKYVYKYAYDLMKLDNIKIDGKEYSVKDSPYKSWVTEDCYEGKYPQISRDGGENSKPDELKGQEPAQENGMDISDIRGRK